MSSLINEPVAITRDDRTGHDCFLVEIDRDIGDFPNHHGELIYHLENLVPTYKLPVKGQKVFCCLGRFRDEQDVRVLFLQWSTQFEREYVRVSRTNRDEFPDTKIRSTEGKRVRPEVEVEDRIELGNKVAFVLRKYDNGGIFAGYCQYPGTRSSKPWKPIGVDVVWDGNRWKYKSTIVPDGSYLQGREARIVEEGSRS